MPAGGILISPWSDMTHSFPSIHTNTDTVSTSYAQDGWYLIRLLGRIALLGIVVDEAKYPVASSD